MSDDFPTYRGEMEYYCLGCGRRYPSYRKMGSEKGGK